MIMRSIFNFGFSIVIVLNFFVVTMTQPFEESLNYERGLSIILF